METAKEYDPWPLDNNRKFKSKFFTKKELTAKQQQNDWLKHGGIDFEDGGLMGPYQDYHDYNYTYYECMTIKELKQAFLYGNWSIRQCFTYKNLAFINQVNAGDEWWTLKKFEDGTILAFESITMIRTINHEVDSWAQDFRCQGSDNFRVILRGDAERKAEEMTKDFHAEHPEYANKSARYWVGDPKDQSNDFGIYFVDVATDYFPEYIEQLLNATYEQCRGLGYTSEEFNKKWRGLG